MEPSAPTKPRNDRGKRDSRQVDDPVSAPPESTRCKMDPDHMFGIVGIVGTVLNLLVVVLVYIYTPI